MSAMAGTIFIYLAVSVVDRYGVEFANVPLTEEKTAPCFVVPEANVSPLAERGLNETFGLAVGARSVRPSETVTNVESQAVAAELMRAIATSVVGEQPANANAMLGKKDQSVLEKSDGGGSLLIGQELREG